MWRRGIEDMELYWLAKQWGDSVAATAVLNTIVPAAFNQLANGTTTTNEDRQPEWSQDQYQFERARFQLANILDPTQGGYTPPTPPVAPIVRRLLIKRHP